MSARPTIVILPGWGGSQETWKDFIVLLKHDYNVVCINLPCFGNEPCPNTVWGVSDYATFVEKKIQDLNLSKPILIGQSFGGQVATQLAVDYPENFSALILLGAASIRPWRPLRRLFFYCVAKTGKYLFRLPFLEKASVWGKEMLYRAVGSRDYRETAGIKRDIFRKIIREDLKSRLSSITTPTLVVWGTKDRYVPLRYGKKIAQKIPHATLHIIQDGGHGLHIHNKQELLQAIKKFI